MVNKQEKIIIAKPANNLTNIKINICIMILIKFIYSKGGSNEQNF